MAGVKIIEERCTGMLLKKRNGGIDMAENMTPAEETKEVVSKNFIEQEIDKDLAEGVYDHVRPGFHRSQTATFISDMQNRSS